MNELTKSPSIIGFAGKLEGSYGAGGSLTLTTDGIQLAESPKLAMSYAYTGTRAAPPGTTGYQPMAKPLGRIGSLPVKHEVKPAGAPYSSSVKPSLDLLLRIGGCDAALTTTGGAEKYAYSPTPGPVGYASAVLAAYARGELYPLTAAYADWDMGADGADLVYLNATISALVGAITDQITPPTITYPLTTISSLVSGGAGVFSIGTFVNANLRKWSLKMGRSVTPRLGGIAGFAIGRRTPQLTVTFETPALTTTPFHAASALDPYNLFDNASSLAASIAVGSVQYNKFNVAMPAVQLMSPAQTDEDGDSVITTLVLQLNPSAQNLNDEFTITFN